MRVATEYPAVSMYTPERAGYVDTQSLKSIPPPSITLCRYALNGTTTPPVIFQGLAELVMPCTGQPIPLRLAEVAML